MLQLTGTLATAIPARYGNDEGRDMSAGMTSQDTKSGDWDAYAAGARHRLDAATARAEEWNRVAYAQAVVAAHVLGRDFGAVRVTLFGSVARGAARPGSDIDLLVEGVAPSRWFDACAAAADAVTCAEVDLVPQERAHAHVLSAALAESRVLIG